MIVLVTGGARSGKSRFAERYAASIGSRGKYIATAQIYDEEMSQRAEKHRERRNSSGFSWRTVEEPYRLGELLAESDDPIVLVDCLTLWLSNWLLLYADEERMEDKVQGKLDELTRTLAACAGTVILVTNEVGDGIVPEYALGRQFRDLSGAMNQAVAAISDQVFLVTAGIPIELKSKEFKLADGNG
ncbi:bifunctional adenosylcobinamide kinase/adenosylcobinamide-phosphate guanylyltransferase [Cohnella faecalis]|uniref:Adenosylcobinamide kinase n=1 Tax=Cohnella faecalis TaxID=2315694 RepID=A0A398CXP2_9BACL|nr:bifunctional adenosylcobinamide kinase/adenosylcobinamide-phosphate guanylyltransferase [Cohnella faecalis]RIE04001.1 bifunctional adenosylcobinamide kinase/adenosylcobinamide-phosphate guanylyltransferase [Cohnella faecalis]